MSHAGAAVVVAIGLVRTGASRPTHSGKVRPGQGCAGQVDVLENGHLQAGVGQVGLGEAGVRPESRVEVGMTQVGVKQTDIREGAAAEVEAGEIGGWSRL